ncbi:MAG: class I SAM-dependent methyltransferase [Pirellulaceae bacterium]|nr:class I SAM-dependent methyltransferase [Pirellulaceae bacterium]
MPKSTFFCTSILLSVLSAAAAGQDGAKLIEESGIHGGVVVHLGCGDGDVTAQLAAGPQYVVLGLDTDMANVSAARRRLLAEGRYGKVAIDRWDGRRLPLVDNFVNLIVVGLKASVAKEELLRVLCPGGMALFTTDNGQLTTDKIVKPWPAGMDQWTHYLHGPDGNPTGNDTLVAPPTRLQWLGGPGWARHHDHMASMSALVSANGRLFYILDEGSRASIQLP